MKRSPIFDCQSHVFPKEYASLLTTNTGSLKVVPVSDQYELSYHGYSGFRINPARYDIGQKLADMDENGVDMALLSINIPGPELLEHELSIEGARLCNDYIASVVARHPDRFVGAAVLPWMDKKAAQTELKRATGPLGLRAVVLYSHLNGKPVDDVDFQPLYAELEANRTPIVMHPTFPTWANILSDYSMVPMLGMMVDTSIAMLRLILSGTLERHPELTIINPHCGGVLPYLMPRIVEQTEIKRRGREHINQPPDAYYRKVFLDLVSPSAQAMRYAIEFMGIERCLFGTDHPWVSIETLISCVDELGLNVEEREKLLFRNAANLFGVTW